MKLQRHINRKSKSVLVKNIVVERQQAKLVIGAILETVEAFFGRPLPKELLELVLADVDGILKIKSVVTANDLKELINTAVTNFRAANVEPATINQVEGGNR